MFLATGSSFDFMQFLQILCWILFPAMAVAAVLTIFFHYRKKRISEPEAGTIGGSPEIIGYTRGDGEFICFDHSALINDYKKRLTYAHAKITALQKDLGKTHQRYDALAAYMINKTDDETVSAPGLNFSGMPVVLRKEVERMALRIETEKKERDARMNDLNEAFKKLEEENRELQAQIGLQTTPADEKDALLISWQEKNRQLSEQVAAHEWLQFVLEDNNAAVSRLHERFDSETEKVRVLTESNQELSAINGKLKDDITKTIVEAERIQDELLKQKSETGRLQLILAEMEKIVSEKDQIISEYRQTTDDLNARPGNAGEAQTATMLYETNKKAAPEQKQAEVGEQAAVAPLSDDPAEDMQVPVFNPQITTLRPADMVPLPAVNISTAYLRGNGGEMAVH